MMMMKQHNNDDNELFSSSKEIMIGSGGSDVGREVVATCEEMRVLREFH